MAQRTGVLIGLLVGGVSTEYTDTCVLTNKMPVISQPSLVTCFSRSERVCCGSAHDYLIGEAIQGLFPPSCAAKFKEFQNLFCSVCDYSAKDSSDSFLRVVPAANGEPEHVELDMCDDFLTALWGSDNFDEPSSTFDKCGFLVDPDTNDGGTILLPMAADATPLPGQPNKIHDVATFLTWLAARFPKVFGNLPLKFKRVGESGDGPLCGLSSSASPLSLLAAVAVASLGFLL